MNARRQLRHSQPPSSSGNRVSSAQYGQYSTACRLACPDEPRESRTPPTALGAHTSAVSSALATHWANRSPSVRSARKFLATRST